MKQIIELLKATTPTYRNILTVRLTRFREWLESTGFGDVEISGDKATANATWLQIVTKKDIAHEQ